MKLFLTLALFFTAFHFSFSQNNLLVFFDDKGDNYVELSQRSKDRRAKNNAQLDERDKEIKFEYLEQISINGTVKTTSRWLNAAHYETTLTPEELQALYPFIKAITPISQTASTIIKRIDFEEEDAFTRTPDYGVVNGQISQIGVDCMHSSDFKGEGVYVAVIDAGFRGMDTLSYFSTAYAEGRVLDTFNFIHDSSVYKYSGHGTAVSSCIIGEKADPLSYYGTAYDASVALYVTEDVSSETLVEEFNLVAALERCDVQGVDVANISLGYSHFDDPAEDHAFEDLDGETTIAAIGVNTAATKGIIVVTSAGNSGPDPISTPCDADSCLCVGAVNEAGLYAPFSSVGFSADGQVKPDVVATGWKTWVIVEWGGRVRGNGTSFSSPLTAGAVACLVQAHPTTPAMDIISAIQESGAIYDSPSVAIGYGLPNFCEADKILGGTAAIESNATNSLYFYPNPAQTELRISGLEFGTNYVLNLFNQVGQLTLSMNITNNSPINISGLENGLYYAQVNGVFADKILIRK